MKKILKIFLLLTILIFIYFAYAFIHSDNRYFLDNQTYTTYVPKTPYQDLYPVADYVDERLNAMALLRAMMIGSMTRYEELIEVDKTISSALREGMRIFQTNNQYRKLTQELQYEEVKPVTLEYVGEQYDHNFEYTVYTKNGESVRGNVAIWGDGNEISTAISFLANDGSIDTQKALAFSDDSNSEMLAYLLIEACQDYFSTNYEPNQAAQKFFGASIETVAGSISYHALVSYLTTVEDLGAVTFDKVKVANISTIDEDGFLVNQSY